ncbi:MAG: threonine/serine dehydratase [bacterium]|nr:threonine/serine dehydratase [bacterium]
MNGDKYKEIVYKEALEAEERISPHIVETPLEYSRYLSRLIGGRVFLKLENVQVTGSFKFRGAANFILSLSKSQMEQGIVTASTGNHAAAFAEMMERTGYKGTIYLPENTSQAKVDVLRTYDVDLEFKGKDTEVTETYARKTAEASGRIFVPPYNHLKIIGGQATAAVEITRRLSDYDVLLAPVGGGGLMAGVSGYTKKVAPDTACIGCQPENSPVMAESVKAGKIIQMASKPTLADGTAGGIEENSITFDICRETVDNYIVVTEEEIATALHILVEHHCLMVEGAAALSIACLLKEKERFKNKTVVAILSGKKITLEKLRRIICLKD